MKKISILIISLFIASNIFAINTPTHSSPANNSTNINPQISLMINHVTGATDYDYQLDTAATFDSPDLQTFSHSDYYYGWTVSDLRYGQKYYWRIRARNSSETSTWSSAWNFTTKNYGATLQSPYNDATNINLQVSLFINKVTGSENYDYQLDTIPTFDSPDLKIFSHSNSYSGWTVSDLRYGQKYYWRARGRNDADTSSWTSAWNFTTKNYGVTLQSPASGSIGISTTKSLYINKITGSEDYDYQIDTIPTFNSPDLKTYTHSDVYSGQTVTNLRYGQKYYWRVRGRNDSDTSNWTAAWNFTTLDNVTPDTPDNNTTGTTTSRSIICDYESGNTSADNYEFEMDTTTNFNSPLHTIEHGNTRSSSWIYKYNSNLRYGTKYYWRVRVRNEADTSQWSVVWNFTTLDNVTPDTPDNNSVGEMTSRSIICDYESGNTNADNYEFEMDTTINFNSPLHTIAHGNTLSSSWIYKYNSNLRYGTKYYWRVRVRNSADTSQWSVVWNFTTLDNITLDSPANNSTGKSINQSIICDYESGNTSADNYEFEMDTTINFNSPLHTIAHGDMRSSSWIYKYNSGLRYGQRYYWRARVRNANDTSQWSIIWNFKTEYELTEVPVLLSPANNSTGVSYSSFSIDWNSVAGANNYQYQISETNDFTSIIRSGTISLTNRTITNLQPNTMYYWRVRGENINGYSNWSAVWNFTTETVVLVTPVLTSPANNATEIEYASVDFDWQDVFGANEYNFEISQDENFSTGVTSLTVNNSDNNLINLNNSTTYYWRVSATDGVTTSSWSDVWNFTTKDAPVSLDAPTLVSPADYATDVSINPTLDWNAVSGATSYEYQYGTDYSFIIYTEGTTGNTETSISGLAYQTQYYWRVRATDGTNYSAWSDIYRFDTEQDGTAINPPTLVSPVDASTNQSINPTLTWNSVTNATTYEYQYSTTDYFGTFISGTTPNTSESISNLNNNITYYWRVRASDGTNTSDWSEVWSFTTVDASGLATPTLVSPSNGETNITLSPTLLWNIVPSANEYEYQYSTDNTFTTYAGNTTQSSSISIGILDYNTTYYWRIKATDGTNFSDWSEVWSFTTENNTGIEYVDNEISLFPNPANNFLNIKANDNIKYISVYNILGKEVFTKNIYNGEYKINTADFTNGIYIIKIAFNSKNDMYSSSFIVKH